MFFISSAILIVFLGAQIFLRTPALNWRRFSKYFFASAIILVFIFSFFQSYQQYQFWLKNDVSKYLLPPYQNISYFIFYALARFFAPYLISLVVSLIFLFSANILNKKCQERFFYPEEAYFGALSFFLISHPGWLFYLIFIIFIYLLIHAYSLLITHGSSLRLSLYHLWIPTAIFVIIIERWLQALPMWQMLKF